MGARRRCRRRSLILIALYYRICGLRALDPVRRRWRCCSPRCTRVATETLEQARAAPGHRRRRRALRDRRGRGARAGADLRAGERLAHRRARPDGAGHRLDRRRSGRCRCCAGSAAAVVVLVVAAHRLGAAHRRRRRRHDADLQLDALWLRRAGGVVLGRRAICCASAPTTCRRAWSNPRAILFTVLTAFLEIRHYMNGGDIYRPSAALGESRAAGLRAGSRWRSGSNTCAAAPAASCTTSAR